MKTKQAQGAVEGEAPSGFAGGGGDASPSNGTYAIVEVAGSQVRVEPGATVRVQKLPGKVGGKVTFAKVLLLSEGGKVQVGLPYVAGAKVEAQITAAGLEKKVLVAKFKRRKKVRRLRGHRQAYTEIKIVKIGVSEKAEKVEKAVKGA